jgi:hypothetical protein
VTAKEKFSFFVLSTFPSLLQESWDKYIIKKDRLVWTIVSEVLLHGHLVSLFLGQ